PCRRPPAASPRSGAGRRTHRARPPALSCPSQRTPVLAARARVRAHARPEAEEVHRDPHPRPQDTTPDGSRLRRTPPPLRLRAMRVAILPSGALLADTAPGDAEASDGLSAGAVPPMPGGEYVNADWVAARWADLNRAFAAEIRAHRGPVVEWLSARHHSWHTVGKVCVHLAENRGDEEHPFAFLATYAVRAG